MSSSTNCEYCKNDFPLSRSRCPHCARPSLFPNVIVAAKHQDGLDRHYDEAKAEAETRRAKSNVEDFEHAVIKTFAVINRPLVELQRLVNSDNEVYATYYQLSEDIRLQKGEEWDPVRQAADAIFFTGYHREIRFAALSLDSEGLKSYGDCSLVLREDFIAHRASLFIENTAYYYSNDSDFRENQIVAEGYRALWDDRTKLCVVKLAKKIDSTTTPDQYSSILLKQGAKPAEDEFIEVHIYGPMTIRTIEEIRFNPVPGTLSKRDKIVRNAQIEAIKEKAETYGVKVS